MCNDTDEKGPYNYNTKSKASWYWSRSWGACERLGCKYYVLTDYQRWVFGTFDDNKSHGYVSKIKAFSDEEPSVGQALLYWAEYVPLSSSQKGVWLMVDPLLETSKDSALPRRMFLEWKLYSLITQLDETRPRREERASRVSRRLMRVM
jgi:hypothetical protein